MSYTVLHNSFLNPIFKATLTFLPGLESSSEKTNTVRGIFFAFKVKGIQFSFQLRKMGDILILDLKGRALFFT